MKKRKGSRRQSRRRTRFGAFSEKPVRPRRSWTFEQLEERHFLTAAPLAGLEGFQWYSVSNSTPEGQQLIDALELMWAEQSTAATNQTGAMQAEATAAPTDPHFGLQWHLFNVGQVVNPGQFQDLFGVPGQDINVIPVWDQGITGAGVVVAVVDTGVELAHPDLIDNLALEWGYDALRDRPGGAPLGDDPHGTAVAGLIAAVDENGLGGVGVAHGATIVPIRFLGAQTALTSPFINAIGANGAPIDVYNHSWGPSFGFFGRAVAGPDVAELIALSNSARLARDGLGAIHVFASGNSAEGLHSAGSNGYITSRYTIGVGMVDHDGAVPNSDGTSTRYGEMAPSVLIVAPSASGPTDIINDFNTGSGIFTTDQTGDLGYNIAPLPSGVELDIDTFPDPDYTTRFGGTSAAAPLVSGVVALMLEVNPNLTWRDVQEILVRSARQNDDLDESWITNLVPLFRDPIQGFGAYGTVYPNDGDPWNDEIVYRLVPGTLDTPAMQATTGPVPTANTEFTVTAIPDGPWDGWVANNLSVVFRTVPGDTPGVTAELIAANEPRFGFLGGFGTAEGGHIRITVTDDFDNPSVTWGDIKDAMDTSLIDFFTLMPLFDVVVGDPDALFDPADEAIVAPLMGGLDETGLEMTLERARQYEQYHPIADPLTNPEPKSLFTNGAGYTVSHGRGGSPEYGWAHGVVNAALAVELAAQWHLKGQNLPPEKTYLVGAFGGVDIRGAEVTNEDSGEYVIPGGLSNSNDGFAEFFNEFFVEPEIIEGDPMAMPPDLTIDIIDPDSLPFTDDDPPVNTRGVPLIFQVPAIDPNTGENNLMTLEWVEVQLTITGDADTFNNLRITLVSPDGTHSELTANQYRPANVQHNFQSMATGGVLVDPGDSITPIDESGNNTDTLNWVYSTNRIWGERSDSKPIFDENGVFVGSKTWELHFENYGGSDLRLNSASIGFHGSPIGSPAQPVERVMGKVGVDAGRFIPTTGTIVGAQDGAFNFDRYVTTLSNNSNAFTTSSLFGLSTTPFGQHEIHIADATQEKFAGNITVYALDNNTGDRVAEFITGYDGNYYFDLPDNDLQATTGFVAAENTVFAVSAKRTGFYRGSAGNDIGVSFQIDDSVVGATAAFDGTTIHVSVRDTTVPWSAIRAAIEAVDGGGQFAVDVVDPTALFAAADESIVATLSGGMEGSYTIGIEDPLGRTALPDGINYDDEWIITIDDTDFFTREAGEIDPVTGKVRFFNDLNFLLDPGSLPEGEVTFTGQVTSDLDGDGVVEEEDVGVPNFRVFADLNHTRQFELGEPFVLTDENGNYTLDVPTGTPNTFSIAVQAPPGWTNTLPPSGIYHEYAQQGDLVEGLDFAYEPPSEPTDIGNAAIFGFIYNDRNGDAVRQPAGEKGLPNFTVFIDADEDGVFDEGVEVSTTTDASGAFTFHDIPPGTVRIDVVIEEPYVLTFPKIDGFYDVTVVSGQVVKEGIIFGAQNLATHDFGDLVGAGYRTTGPDAARHLVEEGFSLGATVDSEIRPRTLIEVGGAGSGTYLPDAALHGVGDDQEISNVNFDDEDGVFLPRGVLRPGANQISVTVNGVGGYLQGWFDFNRNNAFEPEEQLFTDVDLNPGTHIFEVIAPEHVFAGEVAARFRWGTAGIDFFGPDIVGEVEDYLFDTGPALPVGDFDGNMVVDNDDYMLWRETFGSTTDLRADANFNGVVDAADYIIWRKNAVPGSGGGAAASSSSGAATAAASSVGAADLSANGTSFQRMTDAERAVFDELRLQLSLAALGERNAAAAARTAAWADRVGAEAVVVDTPNGPQTRYIYYAPAANQPSSPPVISANGGAVVADESAAESSDALSFAATGFTTTVSPTVGSTLVQGSAAGAAASVDSALLLLAVGGVESPAGDSAADSRDAGFDSLIEDRGAEEMDLALAAVFDEETNWRAVL